MRVQLTFRLRPSSFSVLCVFLILSAAGICGQTDATKQVFDREDPYLNAETSAHSFRGAVLVGSDGNIAFEKGYGFADEEWGVHNTPTTKFRIASLGKQFTAASYCCKSKAA